jgi:hypothetical protein
MTGIDKHSSLEGKIHGLISKLSNLAKFDSKLN